jgi:hypothetical protein
LNIDKRNKKNPPAPNAKHNRNIVNGHEGPIENSGDLPD